MNVRTTAAAAVAPNTVKAVFVGGQIFDYARSEMGLGAIKDELLKRGTDEADIEIHKVAIEPGATHNEVIERIHAAYAARN